MGTKFPGAFFEAREKKINRFDNILDDLLAQRSKLKVLRFLCGGNAPVSGREMGRFLGLDHKTCCKILKDLQELGIVRFVNNPEGNFYHLNFENHLVSGILSPLFERERTIISQDQRRSVYEQNI